MHSAALPPSVGRNHLVWLLSIEPLSHVGSYYGAYAMFNRRRTVVIPYLQASVSFGDVWQGRVGGIS